MASSLPETAKRAMSFRRAFAIDDPQSDVAPAAETYSGPTHSEEFLLSFISLGGEPLSDEELSARDARLQEAHG